MKKFALFLSLFIITMANAQYTPYNQLNYVKLLKIPPTGSVNDSVVMFDGSDSFLKMLPISALPVIHTTGNEAKSGVLTLNDGLKINPTALNIPSTVSYVSTFETDGTIGKITPEKFLEPIYNTSVKVEYPDLFTFRPFTIYEKNNRYYTDFKVSSLVSDKISKMLPYYVNFTSGNNTNDGKTPATAFKTISYAYSIGARLIYLSKGVHLSSWGSLNPSYTNIDDFFVIGASDGVSIVTNAPATFPTFSLVSGTAYSATITSNTLAVDLKYSDSYGFPLKLKEVFTQAECIAELGTFYKNANVITVNLEDGRVPDDNLLIPASTPNADYSGNAGYHYIKDITFIGGGFSSGSHGSDSVEGSNSTLVALSDNCKFLYAQSSTYIANGGEGSRNRYNKLTMFENCVAYGNSRDGFNYVSDYDNNMSIVEINCQAFNNGLRGISESVNGSSTHRPSYIIRLNCKYYNNYGPNIADQGGAITYNVGVECFNSAVPLNIDFNIQPSAGSISYMYNRGCTSYGSTYSFKISLPGEAHMVNVGNHYGGIVSVFAPDAPQTITFADSFTSADAPVYTFPTLSSYTANTEYLPINNPTATGTFTTPSIVVSGETANTIASFDALKNLKSLPLDTYPSLTELSYSKGVTSGIQTQLNALNLIKPTYGGGGESIDVLTAEGFYQISTSSTGVKPVFTPRVFSVLRGAASTFITQVAYGSGNSRVAVRSSINSGSTWSAWEESAPNILTGYVSGAGTVASTDTVLQAIQKLNGNDGLNYSGSYTPTYTATANISSITHQHAKYTVVGKIVTIDIRASVNLTVMTNSSSLRFTLPVSLQAKSGVNCVFSGSTFGATGPLVSPAASLNSTVSNVDIDFRALTGSDTTVILSGILRYEIN